MGGMEAPPLLFVSLACLDAGGFAVLADPDWPSGWLFLQRYRFKGNERSIIQRGGI